MREITIEFRSPQVRTPPTVDSGDSLRRSFLEYYREKMDREMITLDVVESKVPVPPPTLSPHGSVAQIEHRMVSLEGRLEGARERIGILASLLQMKEVRSSVAHSLTRLPRSS